MCNIGRNVRSITFVQTAKSSIARDKPHEQLNGMIHSKSISSKRYVLDVLVNSFELIDLTRGRSAAGKKKTHIPWSNCFCFDIEVSTGVMSEEQC